MRGAGQAWAAGACDAGRMMGRRFYRIRIRGRFDPRFLSSFADRSMQGVCVEADPQGTVLSGVCVDGPALFGVLEQIRDLGLDLLDLTSFEIAPVPDPAAALDRG